MYKTPSIMRAQIFTAYNELLTELKIARKLSHDAGWSQRNAVISHVSSGYNQHENVLEKSNICENLIFRCHILKELSEKLKKQVDLYGYRLKYKEMIHEFNRLISQSIESENYETAGVLKKLRDRFPEAE